MHPSEGNCRVPGMWRQTFSPIRLFQKIRGHTSKAYFRKMAVVSAEPNWAHFGKSLPTPKLPAAY